MGRTTQSQGLAPPAIRKDIRAKQARHIVNKVIPALLASNGRARRGVEASELIIDPPPLGQSKEKDVEAKAEREIEYVKRKGQGRRKTKGGDADWVEDEGTAKGKKRGRQKRSASSEQGIGGLSIHTSPSESKTKCRVLATDTLTVAQLLTSSSGAAANPGNPRNSRRATNVCVLNMASLLRPGGGVLAGATSQEEFLCARSTLLPSLREEFYRLPEVGGVFTPDVLVFRNALPLGAAEGELKVGERYWVDVVSAGMLRFPELEGEEWEIKRLSKKDRELVERKMRAVLRIACAKGAGKVVLGAWGCGAYGNPVHEIAKAWRRVLVPSVKPKKGGVLDGLETWVQLSEVVFAIANQKMAVEFADAFGDVEVERAFGGTDESGSEEGRDEVAGELRKKIQEMEGQIAQVWNPDLKARMGVILEGLRAQLKDREQHAQEEEDEEDEEKSDELAESGDDISDEGGHVDEETVSDEEDEDEDEDDGDTGEKEDANDGIRQTQEQKHG